MVRMARSIQLRVVIAALAAQMAARAHPLAPVDTQEPVDALVWGDGVQLAAVGRPSRLLVQLLDADGRNISRAGDAGRLVVSSSPPPYGGSMKDRGHGLYEIEVVHEWVTSTAPQHGLTNVTVMLNGRHVGDSPYLFGSLHQLEFRPRPGAPAEVPPGGKRGRGLIDGAYVTLVATDEFALGAVVLAHALRKVDAAYPLVALLTHHVGAQAEATLSQAGVLIKRVAPVSNPFAAFKAHLEEQAWEQVYTKTQAWALEEYARVVFMDADQLVLQNIDEIMTRPLTHDFAAVPDVAPPIFFNSGFMVLKPSLATFNDMQEKMHVLPSYDDGDQGFLNAYFGQSWDRLPYVYNFVKSKTGNPEAFYWLLDFQWWSIKVIHMVGVKPWKCTRYRDCGGFPERVIPRLWALWWDYALDLCDTSASLECFNPVDGAMVSS